jgi:hypothetical protein
MDYADGVTPRVILVDRKELAQLMIEHAVGATFARQYKVKRLELDYFVTDDDAVQEEPDAATGRRAGASTRSPSRWIAASCRAWFSRTRLTGHRRLPRCHLELIAVGRTKNRRPDRQRPSLRSEGPGAVFDPLGLARAERHRGGRSHGETANIGRRP